MSIGEFAGYIASALVFATFYMKTMMRLRIIGIVSNVVFITYALLEGLLPVLILHASLLPLNIVRLREFMRMIERTREASRGDISFEALLPFMTPTGRRSGDVLFERGEHATEMFYICAGRIRLPEIGKVLLPGETLGEIGLFSKERARTTTAICETDCELLSISEERFLQLYNENPRFGFYIVRVITGRLIENYDKIAEAFTRSSSRDVDGAYDNKAIAEASPLGSLDNKRPAPERPPAPRSRYGSIGRATIFVLFLCVLALGWVGAPYFQSVFLRNAVVTTWSNVSTAPIDGTINFAEATRGSPVGADGTVALIRNEHLSRSAIDEAEIRVERARVRVSELSAHLDEVQALDDDRGEAKARYADEFRAQLDTNIANLETEIASAEFQFEVLTKIAERAGRLSERGTISANEADEADLRLSELDVSLARMRSDLKAARVRRAAADSGIFMTGTGSDPNWVFDWRMDLKMAKKAARLELRQAEAELATATASLAATETDFERLSNGVVTAPPGSIIWSRSLASGATVRAGDPVAEWVNCSVLLVVVPVINLELALITQNMEAEILLDGEREERLGRVVMTRGASSPFDRSDLVALPDERHDHAAEVMIDITDHAETFGECPVGRSAYVDFPDIGPLDIARAWLRF